MREGSLEAPVRQPLDWSSPAFTDWEAIHAEMERVFDICHGCRRCLMLCDSFPRLFDLIDASESGELAAVAKEDYKQVVDACTLCDMCFMASCPYVPPHEFNLDFPHLMLRYRAAELKQGRVDRRTRELTKTDRNGRLGSRLAALANWASDVSNSVTRPLMERGLGVHREAELPHFAGRSFLAEAGERPPLAKDAPAYGRKAVLYATCFVNYNSPKIGRAARAVLARNGVETEVVYPRCCGMPQLEQGDLAAVAASARQVSNELLRWVEEGYDVIALVPSCALMLKFEWPLILPDEEPIARLARATYDVSEYLVEIARKEGLAEGLRPLDGGVALHIACHARAQNMGLKARDLLKLIPETEVKQLPRCSGHGGSWGVLKAHFPTALKVGKPVARDVYRSGQRYLASECPLAGAHIRQGIERIDRETSPGARKPLPEGSFHPVELFARAYGIDIQ